jgi:antitoxin component HigA of HigAB toxin-antitoxin module
MPLNNESEFDESLKKLGHLYEEGKDCLHQLSILEDERGSYHRVFEILKEMRDLSAVTIKKLHTQSEN